MNCLDIDRLKDYQFEELNAEFIPINKTDCYRCVIDKGGENEDVAKVLSKAFEYVNSNFEVTVLEDGASAYFNKRLYSLISEFEWKLRKLLYMACVISSNQKANEHITKLESKDFGNLFSLLFIDDSFITKVKDEVKSRNRESFTKSEIQTLISSIDENSLWDNLLGKEKVPSLRMKFNDVRFYRNSVMHSQSISWQKYINAYELFNSINNEIDFEIESYYRVQEGSQDDEAFNETLGNAIYNYDAQMKIAETINGIKELQLSSGVSALQEQFNNLNKISVKAIPELQDSINSVSRYASNLFQLSPETKQIIERFELMSSEMSNAVKDLQEAASAINVTRIYEIQKEEKERNYGKAENGNSEYNN